MNAEARLTALGLGLPAPLLSCAESASVGLKAQALHLADRTYEAFEAISEAEAPAEEFEQHACRAELHRLRSVVLTALGAEETQIVASFCAAISIAKEQKAVLLVKGAEATYAKYRRRASIASIGIL